MLYDALGLDRCRRRRQRRAAARLVVTSSRSSGWSGPATASRRTGSPATSLCRRSERSPPCGARRWARSCGRVGQAARRRPAVRHVCRVLAAGRRPGRRVVSLRVLHEANGTRSVVSHFNKATKGRIVRALLEDGGDPGSARGLVTLLTRLGWRPSRPRTRHTATTWSSARSSEQDLAAGRSQAREAVDDDAHHPLALLLGGAGHHRAAADQPEQVADGRRRSGPRRRPGRCASTRSRRASMTAARVGEQLGVAADRVDQLVEQRPLGGGVVDEQVEPGVERLSGLRRLERARRPRSPRSSTSSR